MVFRVLVHSIADIHTGDDAKGVKVVKLGSVLNSIDLAFDHRMILRDYIEAYHPHLSLPPQ